jgi:hypothetical protein
MAVSPLDQPGYSADIRLTLEKDGRIFSLASIGPHHIVLQGPIAFDAGSADVVMVVDGREQRWPVFVDAAIPFDERQKIAIRDR